MERNSKTMEALQQRWVTGDVPHKNEENVPRAKGVCAGGRVANVTGQLMPGKYG